MLRNPVLFALTLVLAVAVVAGAALAYILGTQSEGNIEFDRNGTLQGTVFDAVTGKRLGGSDLRLTLIQGSSHRNPNRLITDENDRLMGEFTFNDISVTLNRGAARYKLVVAKDEYQPFESVLQLSTDLLGGLEADQEFTEDTAYNFVGNVYLFPLGEEAHDIAIIVERDGEQIRGATVQLRQEVDNNQENTATSNRLVPTAGVYPSLTETTDSQGRATFSGSQLVLGGAYTPVVQPMVYDDIQLGLTTLNQIIVGASDAVQVANMVDLEPGNNPEGLYIVFASNQDTGDISERGTLTVVFNQPVALVGETGYRASLSAGCTDAVLRDDTARSVVGEEVKADISADGLTLTLTPDFSTLPGSTDVNCDLVYSGGQVTLRGDDLARGYSVFNGLTLADGRNTLSTLYDAGGANETTVHLTGPQFEARQAPARTTEPGGGVEESLTNLEFFDEEVQVLLDFGVSNADVSLIGDILDAGFTHEEIIELVESRRVTLEHVMFLLEESGLSLEEIMAGFGS